MSSTELTLDQRDIRFAAQEWLKIGQLSESEKFAEFDQDTLDLMIQEGIRFAIDVVSPTRSESDREGCRIEDGRVKCQNACMNLINNLMNLDGLRWECLRNMAEWVLLQHSD